MQNLQRRAVVLAGSSLAIAAQMLPGVAQAASADAELVSACAEAMAIDKHYDAICDAVEHMGFLHPQSLAVVEECHFRITRKGSHAQDKVPPSVRIPLEELPQGVAFKRRSQEHAEH